MAIQDIETVMDNIATLAVTGIPAEMTAINTDKGDSLLDTSNFSARYFTWIMNNNTYPVSFLQYLDDDPQVIATKSATSLIYPITISCTINENAVLNIPILKSRYNRAIRQFIMNTLMPKYSDIMITKQLSLVGRDLAGNSYEIGEVTFTLSLAT